MSTPNGYDNLWVEAINNVLHDREASVRIVDVDAWFWDRFIGPLCDAIEDTEGDPSAPFADLTTEYRGMEDDADVMPTYTVEMQVVVSAPNEDAARTKGVQMIVDAEGTELGRNAEVTAVFDANGERCAT